MANNASSNRRPPTETEVRAYPAVVAAVDAAGRVRVARTPGAKPVLARVALDGRTTPRVGDRVLVAAGARGERYIVGVLEARPARTDGPRSTPDPAEGALQIERDDAGRRTRVRSEDGALALAAPGGALAFAARDGVTLRGEAVSLEAALSARAQTRPQAGRPASSLGLGPRGAAVATPLLELKAATTEVAAGEVRVVGRAVSTSIEVARHVVGVVEARISRLVERAKNTYRDVQEMSQVRAGRIRDVAEETYHLMGERTVIKAEEDVKVKGAKIYLG